MNSLMQIFGDINDPSVQKVLRALDMIEDVNIEAGGFVFKEGDKSTDFYIIGIGAVEIVKSLEGGGEKVLDTLGSGAFFGEASLFDSKPRSAGVRAVSACRLFKIDKDKFFRLLKNNNEIAITFLTNMLTVVNQRLRHSNLELITLYEVSRIIASNQNLKSMGDGILAEVVRITNAQKGLFLRKNLGAKSVIAAYGYDQSDFNEDLKQIDEAVKAAPKSVQYLVHSHFLVLPIGSDFELGMLVLYRRDSDFEHDAIRLCVSVCEQLGSALKVVRFEQDASDNLKLGTDFISF